MSKYSAEYTAVRNASVDCYVAHESGDRRKIGRANTALRAAEKAYKAAYPTYDLVY